MSDEFFTGAYAAVTFKLAQAVGGNRAFLVATIEYRTRPDHRNSVEVDGHRWWQVSETEFAELVGMSPRGLSKAIESLESEGWVETSRRGTATKMYRVTGTKFYRTKFRNSMEQSSETPAPYYIYENKEEYIQTNSNSNLDSSSSELASVASLPESKPVSVPRPGPAPLPDDWTPTAKHREKAAALGVDLDHAVQKMRDWAFVNDKRKKNWNMTFNSFITNGKKVAPSALPNPPVDLDAAFAAADIKAIRAVTGVLVYEPTEFVTGDVRDRKRLFTEWLAEHRGRIVAAGEKGEKVYQG